MTTCIVNHVALAVTNKQVSAEFYAPIMEFLGYKRKTQHLWRRPDGLGDFILYKTAKKFESQAYSRGQTGLHHLAFNSATKEEVDQFYDLLLTNGVKILDASAHYKYSEGYYAVYFEDPDGLKLELAYTPNQKI